MKCSRRAHREAEANARLISGAPELLEVCKKMCNLFEQIGSVLVAEGKTEILEKIQGHAGDKYGYGSTIDLARKAIAKAEGQ